MKKHCFAFMYEFKANFIDHDRDLEQPTYITKEILNNISRYFYLQFDRMHWCPESFLMFHAAMTLTVHILCLNHLINCHMHHEFRVQYGIHKEYFEGVL